MSNASLLPPGRRDKHKECKQRLLLSSFQPNALGSQVPHLQLLQSYLPFHVQLKLFSSWLLPGALQPRVPLLLQAHPALTHSPMCSLPFKLLLMGLSEASRQALGGARGSPPQHTEVRNKYLLSEWQQLKVLLLSPSSRPHVLFAGEKRLCFCLANGGIEMQGSVLMRLERDNIHLNSVQEMKTSPHNIYSWYEKSHS